jgi:hypothetical protein
VVGVACDAVMGGSKLHEKIHVCVDDGTIILAPQESEDVVVIDRVTFKVELQGNYMNW